MWKKLEAQRIVKANFHLLNRITHVSSSVDKRKLDEDWRRTKHYKQLIQKTSKKADLSDLINKREGFLKHNFQVLPRVYLRSSLELPQEEGFSRMLQLEEKGLSARKEISSSMVLEHRKLKGASKRESYQELRHSSAAKVMPKWTLAPLVKKEVAVAE